MVDLQDATEQNVWEGANHSSQARRPA